MVRNIVVLGGNSHPQLTESICNILGVPECDRILSKFSVGESRCEIKDSVRGKDVFIIQTASSKVNDHFVELCIMISACTTGSARRVTVVLPMFPYSRQPDLLPQNMKGQVKSVATSPHSETVQQDLTQKQLPKASTNGASLTGATTSKPKNGNSPCHTGSVDVASLTEDHHARRSTGSSFGSGSNAKSYTTHDVENTCNVYPLAQARPGYKMWVAHAGTLVASLLTAAGADHVITMDLHDPQYQGYFDVPVDNLYSKPLLKRYILQNIPEYHSAVIVSPDAGGAKRATALADSLNTQFALIHKERRAINYNEPRKGTMMLVGDVKDKVCILVDDLADTGNTITRAARLCKKEGARQVYALLTHGIFSGDAIERVNESAIDRIVVTNSVPQAEHCLQCPKLEVIDISPVFAEAIRRVHHGESISVLFQFD